MSTAEEFKTQGNAAVARGAFTEAVDLYTKAIGLDGSNHVLYSNRSAAYMSLAKFDEALTDAERTVQLKADWGKGYSRKGAALQALGRVEDAMEAYEAGLKIEPGNVQLQEAVESLGNQLSKQQSAMLSQLFGNAFQGDYRARLAADPKTAALLADAAFMRQLDECARNPSLIGNMLQDPRFQSALSVLLGIGAKKDQHHGGHSAAEQHGAAAAAHAHSESKPEATNKKPEATNKKPEAKKEEKERTPEQIAAEALKEEGNALFKERKFSEAAAKYREAAAKDPLNITYLTNLAAVQIEQGDAAEAVKTCEEAVRIGREHFLDYVLVARALARKGNALAKLQNYEAAIEAYRSSMTENRDRKVAEALHNAEVALKRQRELEYLSPEKSLEAKQRGNDAFKASRYPEAIECYTEAIRRNPSDPLLYTNRAAAYLKLLEAPLAVRDCEKTLELDPRNLKAYLRKGTAEHQLKQYYKALETFQKGLEYAENGFDAEIAAAVQVTMQAMQTVNAQGDEAAVEAALRDPEIQQIVADPVVQKALQDMKGSPHAIHVYMRDPVMRAKIMKLNAAGIVRLG